MTVSDQAGQTSTGIPVIDYEGSAYRTEFWEGQGRDYEDAVDRLALAALLPSTGLRVAEVGAGFGRLADLYSGYEQVVLFDYSRTLLREAVERWGHDRRFVFVAGNVYRLPLASASLDALVMVRVMHHLADIDSALAQLRRVMHGKSTAVLEYANKRNVKAILRWLAQRQSWSPFEQQPVEFVELNFDFHPGWMQDHMAGAGLRRRRRWAVSNLRLPVLKRHIPAARLARLDRMLFGLGEWYPLAPSVFVQADAPDAVQPSVRGGARESLAGLFRCPRCGGEEFTLEADRATCDRCHVSYANRHGVWDFKDPVD